MELKANSKDLFYKFIWEFHSEGTKWSLSVVENFV